MPLACHHEMQETDSKYVRDRLDGPGSLDSWSADSKIFLGKCPSVPALFDQSIEDANTRLEEGEENDCKANR